MNTTLPIGTWVRTRYQGQWQYGQLVALKDKPDDPDDEIGIALGIPPTGTLVQTCVWKKGDKLEPRGKPIKSVLPQPEIVTTTKTIQKLEAEQDKINADIKATINQMFVAEKAHDDKTYRECYKKLEDLRTAYNQNTMEAFSLIADSLVPKAAE